MAKHLILSDREALKALCADVREMAISGRIQDGAQMAAAAMSSYPDAAEPHNLLGLMLEKAGRHQDAMRHFRAAWALDPAYPPARYNLDHFGVLIPDGPGAFDREDCPDQPPDEYVVVYDAHRVGHLQRKG